MARYVVMIKLPSGMCRIVANKPTKKEADEVADEKGSDYFVRKVGKRKKSKKKRRRK